MATDEFRANDDFVEDDEDEDEDEEIEVEDGDDDVVDLEAFPPGDTGADSDDDQVDVAGPADAVVTPVADDTEDDDSGPDLDEETDEVEEEEADESLDVLLAREKAAAAEPDLGRLEEPRDGLSIPATPISAEEFTCRSCFLVKNRAQVADEDQLICFDCA